MSINFLSYEVENITNDNTIQSKKRRSLPGPLGHLPKGKKMTHIDRKRKSLAHTSSAPTGNESLNLTRRVAETNDVENNTALWERAVAHCGPEAWPIIAQYTIENIVKNSETGFPRGKVPVLCVVLDKVERLLPDVKAILRDRTGSIGCSIDRSVLNLYKQFLCPGCVLLLKQMSLFSLNWKTFYLNITHSNVVRIFMNAEPSLFFTDARVPENVLFSTRHGSFSSKSPPFSVKELEDLVAECLKTISPTPLTPPSDPIFDHLEPSNSTSHTFSALSHSGFERTPNRKTWSLKAAVSGANAAPQITSDSHVPSSPPNPQQLNSPTSSSIEENIWRLDAHRPRAQTPGRHQTPHSGFRALLGNITSSGIIGAATRVPHSIPTSMKMQATTPESPPETNLAAPVICNKTSSSSALLDLMEDDMDDLLASVME